MDQHFSIEPEHAGLELDEFLCQKYPLSTKRFLRRQVREGHVLVNGGAAFPAQRLRINQVISVDIDEEEALEKRPVAPPEPLVVLHEDDDLVVIDKPASLAVEADRWDRSRPSLVGALLLHCATADSSSSARDFRPRIVHRLDKGTSGVVVVAKTAAAERRIREAFDSGRVEKTYLALVEGEHPLADGERETIDIPLGPDARKSGLVRADEKDGKPACTLVEVAERFRGYTLLSCHPQTGRTHQLRVHLATRGFPLAVDPLYGRRDSLALSEIKSNYRPKRGCAEQPLIDRLTLHAHRISLPTGGDVNRKGGTLVIEAPLPADLVRTLKQLSKVRPFDRRPRQERT